VSDNPSQSNGSRLSLERLIEAARPGLGGELAKMLEEHRGMIEAEATVRLKRAVLDKEAELRQQSEADQVRVTAETTSRVTSEVTASLEAQFKEKLDGEIRRLTAEHTDKADQATAQWKQERSSLVGEANRWRVLSDYQHKLGDASSQLEILRRFLRTAIKFADGTAVYLNKEDGLALWKSEGEGAAFPKVVSTETIDPDWFFSKVVVRGKTIAAVAATGVADTDALTLMSDALKRAIENFGLRLRYLANPEALAPAPAPAPTDAPVSAPVPAPVDQVDPRQLARKLISEIKLSHEKQVLEGRVNSDLYKRLETEIEGARAEYRHQLTAPPEQDFFHEEIIKILADNVLSRLGSDYPGPA